MMPKPDRVFDRDREWNGLVSFASNPVRSALLGVVSGRRRQGKSFPYTEARTGCIWTKAPGGYPLSVNFSGKRSSISSFGWRWSAASSPAPGSAAAAGISAASEHG